MLARLVFPILVVNACARESLTFDFGWKHRTGLHTWAKPDDRPPANPDPGDKPAEAAIKYNDSSWIDVQLPHDGLIATAPSLIACPDGCSGKSYIPRHVLWYRKEFVLPSSWKGDAFWLDFEGSFRETTVWLNGVKVAYHDCGYTPFRVRLDNISSTVVGAKNVISVFVDPDNGDEGSSDHGSGWWYEGGGLYRHVNLVHADKRHIEQDGLFAYSNITWKEGSAASAVVHGSATVANMGSASATVCVSFSVSDAASGKRVVGPPAQIDVAAAATATATASIAITSPQLWSSSHPHLYIVRAEVREGRCASKGALIDTMEAEHGFRSLRYDANEGFFLNGGRPPAPTQPSP